MLAYTGGKLSVGAYYYPVVVDLAGMKVSAKSRPILRDHDPSQIVGHTDQIEINGGSIRVRGVVSASNEYAREVAESSANGFPWQASIGARPTKMIFVDKGETVEVNARKFAGPVYVARQSVLGEVSFVALGADDNTSASVAAKKPLERVQQMNEFEKWLQAKGFDADTLSDAQEQSLRAMFDAEQEEGSKPSKPTVKAKGGDGAALDDLEDVKAQFRRQMLDDAAESAKRIAAIQKAAANHPDIAASALKEDWSLEKVELEVLKAERPKAPAAHIADNDVNDDILGAAVLISCQSPEDSVVQHYNEKTVDAARKNFRRGISLQELLIHAAAQNGKHFRTIRGNERELLKAAFSTTNLSGILSNTANKMLAEGFENVEQAWRDIAAIGTVNDFKIHTTYRLTGDMEYEKVGADGKLKNGELSESSYTNQAETYGKIFSLTRRDIRNDDLTAFQAIRRRLGRGAALKINDVFWTEFLDNSTFFSSGNSNYFDGAATTLQSSSLTTAVQKFRKQTDEDGHPIAVQPRVLLVPPELEVDADELFISTNLNTGGSATKEKVPNRNVHAAKYQPVVSTYLSNSSYTGYSTTAWYLLADPMDMPTMQIVFLDGQQTPTVEEAEADFDTLGIQFRGFHDFGVSKWEYRGGVKSKGAA